MSLKAKLEAVIYAAEEPVTLAQLASLFAADALDWKAEEEAVSAEKAAQGNESNPLPIEPFVYSDQTLDSDSALACDQTAGSSEPVSLPAETASITGVEANPTTSSKTEAETGSNLAPIAENPAETELESKRMARQRDREVRTILRQLLGELIATYASDDRGVEIREIAGGYRMATKPECHDAVRLFVRSLKPVLKLSLPALETLAVIAYKQPVTAPEVNEIRGVDSSGVFGSLLARKLIATAGRKAVLGRPILYKTTREFLLRFGLKDVSELPSMEEFEKMAAIELDEPETGSQDEPAQNLNLNLEDSNLDNNENDAEIPIVLPEPGAAPESAGASTEQKAPATTPVSIGRSPETSFITNEVENNAPVPAVMAAQESAETPAVMAASPSAPTKPINTAE